MIPGVREIVRRALREDVGSGDVTTSATIAPGSLGSGRIRVNSPLVLCGLPVAAEVFRQVDPGVRLEPLHTEGASLEAGSIAATVTGPQGALLTGERTALNFMQRLSGIATLTRRYVEAIQDSAVRLVDTRKTTPGLRAVEKYAVRIGGAHNHRFGLDDGVMLKDNHIAAAGGITAAVRRVRQHAHHLLAIQVEVESLSQAVEAVEAGARVLLLDNFGVDDLRATVTALRERPEELTLEASGGITLESIADFARTGVDVISSGALIHQARWLDLSLDLDPAGP